MTLNLLKRSEKGAPLTLAEHDANFTAIETEVNTGGSSDSEGIAYVAPYAGSVSRTVEAKLSDVINVKDYGATGNGTTDDTAALQLAFDTAYLNGKTTIHMPAGNYKTTSPLYLDPPGNLRASLTTPTIFQFSLALVGDEAGATMEPGCTKIIAHGGTAPALYVGTGQGMRVAHISFHSAVGQALAHPKLNNPAHIGIALTGGSGGSSRNYIEHCAVSRFYTGIKSGANADSLCDSINISTTWCDYCHIGVDIAMSQNYIVNIYFANISNCGTAVQSLTGKAVNIFGGNFSSVSRPKKKFTSVNGAAATFVDFVDSSAGNIDNQKFNLAFTADTNMTNGVYNAFALELPSFGIVPLMLDSYSGGVGTFYFYGPWLAYHYGYDQQIESSDILNEIKAATVLWATERMFILKGTAFDVHGLHVENPAVVTTLLDTRPTGTGDVRTMLSKLFFNYGVTHGDYASSTSDVHAAYACQHVFPFVNVYAAHVAIRDCTIQDQEGYTARPLIFDIIDVSNSDLLIENTQLINPIVRFWANFPRGNSFESGSYYGNRVFGVGRFDHRVIYGGALTSTEALVCRERQNIGVGGYRKEGFRPARSVVPYLADADVTAINANATLAATPLVYGGIAYQISEVGASGALFAKSDHTMWSYGVNIPLTFSYKGASHVVNVSGANVANKKYLFPGLKVILNDGGSDQIYIVTGVNTDLNYFTIIRYSDSTPYTTVGTNTTTYTNTTVKQEPIVLRRYGGRGEAAVSFQLTNLPTDDMALGDGQAVFLVPEPMNGLNLLSARMIVVTAGTTGTSDIQIRRVRAGSSADMLSTKLTIDSTELTSATAATAAVINTSNDDIATDDLICIDVDALSTTKPKGGVVSLVFGLKP